MKRAILLVMVIIASCKTGQKLSNSIHPQYVGKVLMQHAKNLHIRDEVNLQPKKGTILYAYRSIVNLVEDSYIMKGKYIGSVSVSSIGNESYFVVQTKESSLKVGDLIFNKQLGQSDLPLMYKGTILECSKPNQIHIYGTAKDGLLRDMKLDVYRYEDVSIIGEGEFRIEKIKVGQIKVIKDGGSNFSIVEKIKGEVELNDIVEFKPKS